VDKREVLLGYLFVLLLCGACVSMQNPTAQMTISVEPSQQPEDLTQELTSVTEPDLGYGSKATSFEQSNSSLPTLLPPEGVVYRNLGNAYFQGWI